MNRLTLLGILAYLARKIGLAPLVRAVREGVDAFFLTLGIFPLRAVREGVHLSGLLRHRSFLAGLTQAYEPYSRHLFLEALRDGTLVVDGGAHIGWYTCLAAQRLSQGEILAVEPDPFNFAALAFNCRKYSNVTLVRKALGSHDARTVFFSDYGTIGSSLFRRSGPSPKRPLEIEIVTLDTLLVGREAPHLLIKLDLEGAEPLALQGMTETAQRFPIITMLIEHNPQALKDGGFSAEDILRLLWTMGFKVWFVDEEGKRLLPTHEDTALPKGNLLALKG